MAFGDIRLIFNYRRIETVNKVRLGLIEAEDKLTFWKTAVPERQFNREFKDGFGEPEHEKIDISVEVNDKDHKEIMKNYRKNSKIQHSKKIQLKIQC